MALSSVFNYKCYILQLDFLQTGVSIGASSELKVWIIWNFIGSPARLQLLSASVRAPTRSLGGAFHIRLAFPIHF